MIFLLFSTLIVLSTATQNKQIVMTFKQSQTLSITLSVNGSDITTRIPQIMGDLEFASCLLPNKDEWFSYKGSFFSQGMCVDKKHTIITGRTVVICKDDVCFLTYTPLETSMTFTLLFFEVLKSIFFIFFIFSLTNVFI